MTADTCATCGEPAYRQGLYGALTPPLCRDCADTETPEQTAALDSIAERLDGFEAEAKRLSAPTTESVDVATLTEAAHAEVARLCMEPRASWRMSIPANETRDSDLIISNALTASERALAAERSLVSDLAEKIRRRDAEATEMSRGYEDRIAAERSLREAAEGRLREAESALTELAPLRACATRCDLNRVSRESFAAEHARALRAEAAEDAARADLTTAQVDNARLTRWKAEAMTVLAEWEAVYVALGAPGVLGDRKSDAVLAEATATREAVAADIEAHCLTEHKAFRGLDIETLIVCWKCRDAAAIARGTLGALDSTPSGEAT